MSFPLPNLEDVWLIIYDYLDDIDKINFANACPIWHDWLEKKLQTQLFAKVAPILRNYVDMDALLDLRRINSKCSNSIDQALSSHPCNLWLDYESAALENKDILPVRTMLKSTADIQKFQREITDLGPNPFPSSSVCFQFEEGWDLVSMYYEIDAIEEEFWEACKLFLEKFGNKILHVGFVNVFESTLYAYTAVRLKECLERLPNIKSLRIEGSVEETLRYVNEYYCNNNPPRLSQLECVTMRGMDKIMTENILHYCCVPEKVTRLAISGIGRHTLPEEVYCFTQLQVLEAHVHHSSLETLGSAENAPPLREYHGSACVLPIDLETFRHLQLFSTTLFKIRIFGKFVVKDYDSSIGFYFPNVKALSFEDYRGSLDFLTLFSGLTHLEMEEFDNSKDGAIVLDRARVAESTIWSIMPGLQTIVIAAQKYRRAKPKATETTSAETLDKE